MSRRCALGSALLVVCVGGLAAAGTVWADVADAPVPAQARAVGVPDPVSVLVCPGPPVLAGAGVDEAPRTDAAFDPSPVGVVTSLRSAAPTAPTLTGVELAGPDAPAAALPGEGLGLTTDGDTPTALSAFPGGQGPSSLGALHTAVTTEGDLRGLAATGCAAPAARSWLVGGGTEVGRSARLLLANPGTTASTVDLTVLTGEGTQQPAAGQGLVLAPGARRELLVEGLVGDQAALAVGVSSRGAPVSALLVDTRLRGLVPAGTEVVSPSAAPALRQVVPGVVVDDRTALTVRLAVPGDTDAVVRWQLVGAAGPLAEGVQDAVATVAAGTVVDVPLPAPGPGAHALVVESDQPVLAAVAVERGAVATPGAGPGQEPADVAWAGATGALSGGSAVVLPSGDVAAALSLTAGPDGGRAVVELVVVGPDGASGAGRRVSVDEGTTRLVDPAEDGQDPPFAVVVRPVTGTVHAALPLTASSSATEDDLVSVVGVAPAPVAADDVRVSTALPGQWPGQG